MALPNLKEQVQPDLKIVMRLFLIDHKVLGTFGLRFLSYTLLKQKNRIFLDCVLLNGSKPIVYTNIVLTVTSVVHALSVSLIHS